MRFSIFPPVAPIKNQYTELVEKYSKLNLPPEKLKYEIMIDLQKLSDKNTEDLGKKKKKFDKYHYWFKPKFLLPFMNFAKKKLNGVIVNKREDIPDEVYNKNLQIIWDSYEEAFFEYTVLFSNGGATDMLLKSGMISQETYEELKKEKIDAISKEKLIELINAKKIKLSDAQLRGHVYWIPKMFVQFLAQVYLQDTAYRELVNIYIFKIQENMNKHWNPEIQHKYPLYTVLYDNYIPYFIEWMKMTKQVGNLQIEVKGHEERNPFITDEEMEIFKKHMEAQKNERKSSEGSGTVLPRGSEGDNAGEDAGKTAKAKKDKGDVPVQAGKGAKAV